MAVKDITDFVLGQRFDLIIAPYRVLQNLETDAAVSGLFRCIRQHLTPGGRCILNVFHPHGDPETLRREWCTEREKLCWQVAVGGHTWGGCCEILTTFNFQAVEFFTKRGFHILGAVDDYPHGHQSLLLQKELVSRGGAR